MAVHSIDAKLRHAHDRGQRWLFRLELLERRGITCGQEREEAERKSQFWMHRYRNLADKTGRCVDL